MFVELREEFDYLASEVTSFLFAVLFAYLIEIAKTLAFLHPILIGAVFVHLMEGLQKAEIEYMAYFFLFLLAALGCHGGLIHRFEPIDVTVARPPREFSEEISEGILEVILLFLFENGADEIVDVLLLLASLSNIIELESMLSL